MDDVKYIETHATSSHPAFSMQKGPVSARSCSSTGQCPNAKSDAGAGARMRVKQ